MSLSTIIYKRTAKYKVVEKEREKLISKLTKRLDKYFIDKNNKLDKIIKSFIKNYSNIIPLKKNSISTLTIVAKYLIANYNNKNTYKNYISTVKWNIFNNLSPFNHNLSNEIKTNTAIDFIKDVKPLCTLNTLKTITKIKNLHKELQSYEIKVFYCDSYDKLNSYILHITNFVDKGDSYPCIVLSKNNLKTIKKFINKDSKVTNSSKQIDKILKNWCKNCTYVYYPWKTNNKE